MSSEAPNQHQRMTELLLLLFRKESSSMEIMEGLKNIWSESDQVGETGAEARIRMCQFVFGMLAYFFSAMPTEFCAYYQRELIAAGVCDNGQKARSYLEKTLESNFPDWKVVGEMNEPLSSCELLRCLYQSEFDGLRSLELSW